MLETIDDVVKYADEAESLEFDYWHKGILTYTNAAFRVTFVANYKDELEPVEMLRELAYMGDVTIYCKKTHSVIYEDT